MIPLKTGEEIALMAENGRIAAAILRQVLTYCQSGRMLSEIDDLAERLMRENGVEASFKKEPGYRWATCLCLNDVVVHGIPTAERLKDGDILGIDLGVYRAGFHVDTAWMLEVENEELKAKNQSTKKFLEAGEKALSEAVKQCWPGNHVGDISRAIQEVVEGAGYSCVRQLVGHGVGRKLHEDPEIPCYQRGKIQNTPILKAGMTLAVEVIYNQGASPVVYRNHDGWTIVTRDSSPSAVFEHTVAVTENGPQVLTR